MLTAVIWAAAGLLTWAGLVKLPQPDAAMAALHSMGLPSGRIAARLLGLGEIGTAVVVVVVGGRPAAVVTTLTYAALTAVAARQRARQVDCGCFGVRRYPVSRLHVGLNTTFAAAGLLGMLAPPLSGAQVWTGAGPLAMTSALLLVGTIVLLLTTMTERAGLAEAPRLTATSAAR